MIPPQTSPMPVATRACPSCASSLAVDAAFCHRCGTPTPQEINRETGEILVASGRVDALHMARLQRALGDSCEVRRLLGRGGFAEVYVAYDKRLKREVAVKTIRSDVVASSALRERFQREAEAVAKLRHPNVVPIYAVGESDEMAFFIMPLIEGESIASLLEREEKLSVPEACRILREAANALHAAHRAGIVHRDIKPENIMLEGPERSAVVMDFGIAKSSGADATGLTGTGMMMGTPQYMSPEQATGEGELDHRSDQYSLAMVGYRMLAGKLPFEADSLQSQIFKSATEVPTPLASVDPDMPVAVSDAIATALAKRPEDRFGSMTELAAALEPPPVVSGSVSSTVRRIEPPLATRVVRMHETLAAIPRTLIALGFLALIAFVVLRLQNTPPPVLELAAQREAAIFAARQLVSERSPGARLKAYAAVEVVDPLAYRFLIQRVGYDSLLRRAAADVPIWEWVVRLPSEDRRDNWLVTVGSGNRVTSFSRAVNDSAVLSTISIDSARVLAAGEFALQGWGTELNTLNPDATIVRTGRTDYRFTQKRTAGVAPTSQRDSARMHAHVWVVGDRVTRFGYLLDSPEAFRSTLKQSPNWLPLVIAPLVLGVIAFVLALVVRRQRTDDLQWATIARLAAGTSPAIALLVLPERLRSNATATAWTADATWTDPIAFVLIMVTLTAVCYIVFGASAESLAQETRPSTVRGLADVSRGRFVVPEIVPAVVAGFSGGALFVFIEELAVFVERRWFVTSAIAPLLDEKLTSGLSLESLGVTIALAPLISLICLLTVVSSVRYLRISPARAAMVVALLFSALVFASDGWVDAINAFLILLLALVGSWHYGVLATIVAFLWLLLLPNAITLLQINDSGFRLSGALLLSVVLVPTVIACVSYRRYRRPTGA